MVVMDGVATSAGSTSSKPITEQSCGNAQPRFCEPAHHAERGQIVEGNHRGKRTAGGQHLLRNRQTAFEAGSGIGEAG